MKIRLGDSSRKNIAYTWNETIAKRKFKEYIFYNYLETKLPEYKNYTTDYNPKKVAAQSTKGKVEGFTKTEFKNIFKSAITEIENTPIKKLIEDIEITAELNSFFETPKGKEILDESISTLNTRVLSSIFEQERFRKESMLAVERGLNNLEVVDYFKNKVKVKRVEKTRTSGKGKEKKKKVVEIHKKFIIDGVELFKEPNNVKANELKKLGFTRASLGKEQKDTFNTSDSDARMFVSEAKTSSIYPSSVMGETGKYSINLITPLVPISVKIKGLGEQVVPLVAESGQELLSVSDSLLIPFGAEWERNNKAEVERYKELIKPFKEMKNIIDDYVKYINRLKDEHFGIKSHEDKEKLNKKELEKFLKELKTKVIDDPQGKLIAERMRRAYPAGGFYNEHKNILNNITMVGTKKKYQLFYPNIRKDDYKIDIGRGLKTEDNKKIKSQRDDMIEISKKKTEFAKEKLDDIDTGEVKETRAKLSQRKITNIISRGAKGIENLPKMSAEEIFENKDGEIVRLFANQLSDLKNTYFISLNIKKVIGKDKTVYRMFSNKDGKSFIAKRPILFNEKKPTAFAEDKETDEKLLGKAREFINTIKKRTRLLKNIGGK